MRLCRFNLNGTTVFGRIEGDDVVILRGNTPAAALENVTDGSVLPLESIRLLSPVSPGKIIGVGRNYADHAKELGNELPSEPLIFLKPPSAVIACDNDIEMPPVSERVDFEGELAVIIGRRAKRIEAHEWRDYVLGYTCANDVTARDLQKKDVQFTRGKGFDTFCPLGPWIRTDLDPSSLQVTTRVNRQVRQNGNTSSMIFDIPHLLEWITGVMTLEPGDAILTGTPEGVGPLSPGDVVEVEIEGIGTLVNRVVVAG